MWCDNCNSNVPFVASPKEDGRRCADCGNQLAEGAPNRGARPVIREDRGGERPPASEPETISQNEPPVQPRFDAGSTSPRAIEAGRWSLDDWTIDDQLRHVERLVGSGPPRQPAGLPPATPPKKDVGDDRAAPSSKPSTQPSSGAVLAWFWIGIGIIGLAFGLSLLACSVWQGRPRLWDIGLPFTVAGQIGMLIGLILHLERIWQNHRHTAARLTDVDNQLDDLNHATRLLGSVHTSASHAFYAHLAEGASPKILLSDLKSQLDLLAVRISDDQPRK